ncbi:DNA ligase D [Falsiroseomonas tokyonensis]|uniref:DNA ligase (ATP) n=1 Tax=Falsiroseomonas tokyonensis TaxID=430521 RepID=A0ABV7BPL8_9PROT|nr:DNA ligase D [Falsiroseomonas tokyonensis]MBU8537169.1 DNA ligase D [Falsiroseomonas tokyonensis]
MPVAGDSLQAYRAKRNFGRTQEPQGSLAKQGERLSFVVQRHDATRLHYDLRLEWGGVLKSWAVTRGPSLDPADKRLAVEVEDHPLDYGSFEGTIPKAEYGGGTVQLFDRGLWAPLNPDSVDEDLAKGELKFVLAGERLKGGFVLVRMKPRRGAKPEPRHNWLLIKEKDSMATPGAGDAVLRAETSIASGRTLAEIAKGAAPPAKPAAKAKAAPKTKVEPKPAPKTKAAPKAKASAAVPRFVEPQLCRLVSAPPAGKDWLHELKIDGYRLQLRIEGGRATLRTRTGLDWTDRFPAIAEAAKALPDALIDGEAAALDAQGQPHFPTLQGFLSGTNTAPLVFFAFDLLQDGTRDLRGEPLEARKAALRKMLPAKGAVLRYLEHFPAPGEAVLASACRLEMEGIVSKRRDAPYASGRGDSWVKSKCRGRDEFVIGGFSRGVRGHGLGALLVGAWRDGKLAYLGRVGTGYSAATATDLVSRLTPLERRGSAFTGKPAKTSDVVWVKPELVAEVAYGGWTEEGLLRHASFQGLREDKPAKSVTPPPEPEAPAAPRTRPAAKAPLGMSHPDRVLWPETAKTPALTKADLAAYFDRFADRILAHVAGRPLSLLRAPDGITGGLFFQRHAMPGQSPLIGAVQVEGQAKPYMRIDDAAGLAALAQVSAVELHPWGAKADAPGVPDRLVFDLDPDEGIPFDRVLDGARELRERIQALGLAPFARVTGGKGLHVVVPLAPPKGKGGPGWPEAKGFARLVCAMMERDAPKLYTTTLAKKARKGRIFLDYLRNDRLSTAIASWSPRARPGAPVACPIPWSAVKKGLDPAGWTLAGLLAAKKMPADPWADFAAAAGSLRDAIEKVSRAA